jgi:hypothetical protein
MARIAGHDRSPTRAAGDGRAAQPEVELAPELLSAAVAVEAISLEHRADVLLEGHLLIGAGRDARQGSGQDDGNGEG